MPLVSSRTHRLGSGFFGSVLDMHVSSTACVVCHLSSRASLSKTSTNECGHALAASPASTLTLRNGSKPRAVLLKLGLVCGLRGQMLLRPTWLPWAAAWTCASSSTHTTWTPGLLTPPMCRLHCKHTAREVVASQRTKP